MKVMMQAGQREKGQDMEAFDAYGHALAAMGGYALVMMVLGAMSTTGRTPENRCACGQPKRDYDDVVYRRGRAFMNSVESVGPFVAAVMAAMLTGGSPFWVNLLASIFLLARIATAFVHIGTTNQAMRSATWGVGTLCVAGLALIGIVGAF